MIYRIRNIEKDDFIALVFEETVQNLKNAEEENSIILKEVINENSHSKGSEIQEIVLLIQETWKVISPQVETVVLGLISAGFWDIMKGAIRKYRSLHEYSSTKMIEIEQEYIDGHKNKIKITIEEILDK